MGKSPKSNSKTSYTSKGGLGGKVGRKTRNLVRRARRSGELVDESVMRSWTDRSRYWKELSTRRDQKSKDRYAKWEQEEKIKLEASKLYRTYKSAGCTYGARVQALKTNWLQQFTQKWNKELGETTGGSIQYGRQRRRPS